jgi:hypothetical protein
MTKFKIIGAAVLSLVLAGPAMAVSVLHAVHHEHYGRVIHRMPAQFDHDFGVARPTYRSGRTPGTVDDNIGTIDDSIRMPPTANGG